MCRFFFVTLHTYNKEYVFDMGLFDIFSKKKKEETLDKGLEKTKTSVFDKLARDRKSTRLNSSHNVASRMPSSA